MRNTILNYLEKTGKKKEFDLFLKHYHDLPRNRFAVIKFNGETLHHHLTTFAEDIAFFQKMELFPILVFEIKTPSIEQLNSDQLLTAIEAEQYHQLARQLSKQARILQNEIQKQGGRSAFLSEVELRNQAKEKNIIDFHEDYLKEIEQILSCNSCPILVSLCQDEKDNFFYFSADVLAKSLVQTLKMKKLIFLNDPGGILSPQGDVLSFLNLSGNTNIAFLPEEDQILLKQIKEFLNANNETEVVISSAVDILKEIFTIKGSGTYIKNYQIQSALKLDDQLKIKLSGLLENSFHKKLISSYFKADIEEVFFQKNFEAVAIIKKLQEYHYLCKFAVAPFRSGTGLGKAIWNQLRNKYDSLIWRAKSTNPINTFYLNQCQGMIKRKNWHVFWINIPDEKILELVNLIDQLPASFEEQGSEMNNNKQGVRT
ncbi:MAG: hypothetical protein MJB14_07850 [Spirochaetes bacterium]|nr:hypothetical protein [Spirochaetota bacterium]